MHVDLRAGMMMMRRRRAQNKKNAVTFMRREEIKGQKMKFSG